MSVIVRTPSDKIIVFCKGADSIIEKRLRSQELKVLEKTKQHLDEFAKTGLRTLLIAAKEISEAEYQSFASEYQAAQTSFRKEEESEAVASKLETEFELLGSTAIEDKL